MAAEKATAPLHKPDYVACQFQSSGERDCGQGKEIRATSVAYPPMMDECSCLPKWNTTHLLLLLLQAMLLQLALVDSVVCLQAINIWPCSWLRKRAARRLVLVAGDHASSAGQQQVQWGMCDRHACPAPACQARMGRILAGRRYPASLAAVIARKQLTWPRSDRNKSRPSRLARGQLAGRPTGRGAASVWPRRPAGSRAITSGD